MDEHSLHRETDTVYGGRVDCDFSWAVGLFEGEGCIHVGSRKRNETRHRLELNMTDADVVERFQKIVGVGVIDGPYPPRGTERKQRYTWRTYRQHEIKELLERMYPLLSARRRRKADEMFALLVA